LNAERVSVLIRNHREVVTEAGFLEEVADIIRFIVHNRAEKEDNNPGYLCNEEEGIE
jgi:hypothetical protein